MTSPESSRSDCSLRAPSEDAGTLLFEAVTAAHADALQALFTSNAVPAVTAGFDPFPLSAARAREIASEPRQDGYYVLAHGDRLLGFSMLRGADDGYEIPSFGIFIDHAYHGRGFGRMLTTRTLEVARSEGAQAVRLSVYDSNLAAKSLYESLGFAEFERGRVDLNGEAVEKIVMLLKLDR